MIYFIYDRENNAVKIGYSENSLRRLHHLQTGNAHSLVLVAEVDGDKQKEKGLHLRFAKHKIKGEWFQNCKEIREYIYLYAVKSYRDTGKWTLSLPEKERMFLSCLLIYSNYVKEIYLGKRRIENLAKELEMTVEEVYYMIEVLERDNILFREEKDLYKLNPFLFNGGQWKDSIMEKN